MEGFKQTAAWMSACMHLRVSGLVLPLKPRLSSDPLSGSNAPLPAESQFAAGLPIVCPTARSQFGVPVK